MDYKLLNKPRNHPKDEFGELDLIQERIDLETRTQDEVIKILSNHEIKKNSQSWKDYNLAKKILFDDYSQISNEIYDQQIKWITDYLNL